MKKILIVILVGIVVVVGIILVRGCWISGKFYFHSTCNATGVVDDPIELAIANWKTYTNEQLGFEFKYPGNLFATPYLTTNQGRIISDIHEIIDKPTDREFLSSLHLCYLSADKNCLKKEGEIFKNGLVISFEEENNGYKTYEELLLVYSKNTDYSKVTIDNTMVYKRTNGVGNEVAMIKLKGPYYIYSLQMNALRDTCVDNDFECGYLEVEDSKTKILFEQILTTFKFIK